MNEILLIDDESKLLRFFQKALIKKGYAVTTAANGQEARRKVNESNANLIFLDLKLPDASGMDLLQEFVALYPDKIFIMMTAYGDIENAVAAMKAGAFEYMVKPVKLDDMVAIIEKAFVFFDRKEEKFRLKEKLEQNDNSMAMLGVSTEMKEIFELMKVVAPTKASVLLQGESGTGKSMIAKRIHKLSDRCNGPFLTVNCAAIPEQLLESELFGHEKGAFTGAVSSRMGKFETAHQGTLFLDEIGELTPAFQAKLLQVVQDKEFMRVGSDELRRVNVRLITATNRDLSKMVEEGTFREDLFYRLNVIDIYIPPLRERKHDIPLLIEKFIKRYGDEMNKKVEISQSLLKSLMDYSWPGNVRQLENSIERAVILCRSGKLSINDFPIAVRQEQRVAKIAETDISDEMTLREQLDSLEKKLILKALDNELGQAAAAAKKLGISKQNFLYKMNKYFPKE